MNEKIEVGDLVYVAKWGCCGRAYGRIFRVEKLAPRPAGQHVQCRHCDVRKTTRMPGLRAFGDGIAISASMLRKIPPLSELDNVREELTA